MGRDGAFYIGVVVGALLSVPAAVALFAAATVWSADVEWETLVAGAFATLGAAATVFMIRKQISSSREEYHLARSKRLLAARATLSLALSEINAFSNAIIFWIVNRRVGEEPHLSADVVEIIREVIEYNEDGIVNMGLATVIARIQILKARMQPDGGRFQPDDRLVDAVELYALSEAFFDFARDGTKSPKQLLDGERIMRIADFRGIEEEDFPHFYRIVRARNYQNELAK
ncbi:hypothetical protein [Hoeflea sp.]|uniref:hypothetical protein n=1 Tax=Hoeflea sp. TaxID=1940281 RepID=UPI003B52F937